MEEIKVELKYWEEFNSVEIKKDELNGILIHYMIKNNQSYRNLLNLIIDDLSKKQLHNYYCGIQIKVIATSDNLEIIKKNNQKIQKDELEEMNQSEISSYLEKIETLQKILRT